MLSPAQAVLASWSFPPWVTAFNLLAAVLYLRGWPGLWRRLPERFPRWRAACYLGGLVALQVALASPLDGFDSFWLADHMAQHLVLMLLVPPLLLAGNPLLPLLRGLPRPLARRVAGPLLRWPPLQRLGRALTRPAVAWSGFALAMVGWHLPGPYDLALRSDAWHAVEHASFLFASLLFWWPVIEPWPSRRHGPRWAMPIYLLTADVVGGMVSAFLIFSGRVLYPAYLTMPRLGGLSALDDQVLAGVLMWGVGSLAMSVPAIVIVLRLLSPAARRPRGGGPGRAPAARPAGGARTRAWRALGWAALALPLAALAYGYLAPQGTGVDGATVRIATRSGPYRISVFTPPGRLAAGPCPVAVLVQDRVSGRVLVGAPIELALAPAGGGEAQPYVRATTAAAALKLLEAATLTVPAHGSWTLRVRLARP